MNEKEIKRTDFVLRNLFFSIFNNAITMIMPFILRTVTIHYLGSEYLGLNSLCTSVLYVLSAAELGVGNAFVYRLYKPVALHNTKEICNLLNLYKNVYRTIGLFILGAGICIMPFISHFISGEVPVGINIYVVFFIYLLNTTFSYVLGAYKDLILTAEQRKDYLIIISMISSIILYACQIIFIIAKQYYLSIIMLPVVTILHGLLRYIVVRKKYPRYIPDGQVNAAIKKSIKRDVLSVAVYRFRDISRNAFDSVVISSFLGLEILANYQNYYTVYRVPTLLLSIVYNAIAPSMGNYAATESVEDTYTIYRKSIFLQMFLSGWFAICFGSLIQDFITLWLGAEFKLSISFVLLLAGHLYLVGECSLTRMIRENVGLWEYGKKWTVVEMVANLFLNIVLVRVLGAEGVILATVITVMFISIPVENYVIYKYYFKGKFQERLQLLIPNLLWTVVTAAFVSLLCRFVSETSIVGFLYKILICVVVPPIVLVICFHNTDEFKFMFNLFKGIIKGKKSA